MKIIGQQKANCKNCYKCIRTCPVKSIKFEESQAKIIDNDCVLCGKCITECPQNAKTVSSDLDKVKKFINDGERVLISIAPSYVGLFEMESPEQIATAFNKLGVYGVSETSEGAAFVTSEYYRLIHEERQRNIITTCCPVVNDMVEKYYPDVVDYLAPVVSPMIAHGLLLRQRYGNDVKIVFVGPCIAKKREINDIRHDTKIDAVLTFDDLVIWLEESQIDISSCEKGEFINDDPKVAKLYPIPGGILKTVKTLGNDNDYNFISVDGIDNCKELFKALENGSLNRCFVEMSACVGGCVNGSAKGDRARNRFIDDLKVRSLQKGDGSLFPEYKDEVRLCKDMLSRQGNIDVPKEETIRMILRQIGKENQHQELNCGSCGYSSCREKAIAVYQGKADLTMCMPFMKERAESLSNYVLSETPNITIMVDKELNIIEFNEAAQKKFGLTRREALEKGLYELIDTADFEFVFDTKHSIYDKKVCYDEYDMVTQQSIIYIEHDNIVMGIFKDITKDEQSKENLYKLRVDTIGMAQKVINKQMVVAQEIASLLGETTAETKVTLTKLKDMIVYNGEDI